LKKVCYKVSLYEKCQRQSCKAFIGIRAKMIGEPFLGVSGCAIRRSTPCYWYSTAWPHHVRLEVTSLAASELSKADRLVYKVLIAAVPGR